MSVYLKNSPKGNYSKKVKSGKTRNYKQGRCTYTKTTSNHMKGKYLKSRDI